VQVVLAVNGSIKDAAHTAVDEVPNKTCTPTAPIHIDATDVVRWLAVHVQYISYLFQRLPPLTGLDLQARHLQSHQQSLAMKHSVPSLYALQKLGPTQACAGTLAGC
jgi:hypothetical protein